MWGVVDQKLSPRWVSPRFTPRGSFQDGESRRIPEIWLSTLSVTCIGTLSFVTLVLCIVFTVTTSWRIGRAVSSSSVNSVFGSFYDPNPKNRENFFYLMFVPIASVIRTLWFAVHEGNALFFPFKSNSFFIYVQFFFTPNPKKKFSCASEGI